MELTWVSRGWVIASLDGRTFEVGGEALLDRNPDLIIFPRSVSKWDDGTPIGELERADLLDQVIREAARRGWKFEIHHPA